MLHSEIVIIGAGPAGLCAAISAAKQGATVALLERDEFLGGQLVKQTHMFFGSKKQYASVRGIDIAPLLEKEIKGLPNISVFLNSTVLGYYEDGVLLFEQNGKAKKIKPARMIVATGAAEKVLPFPNNDLPGVYGAGAVQTLMNVHGVKPAKRVLMVGAGNIGLIVSYQLLQAGVEVAGVIEAAPYIGGYLVHAAKIRRSGVPILTSHTIKAALGDRAVEGAIIQQLDEKWQPITGTERTLEVDAICLAVGLTPLVEILWQAGCQMKYVPQLGGHVPIRNQFNETSVPGIFVAGDASGVEEASSAMLEGALAGMEASASLGYRSEDFDLIKQDILAQLESLRSGPTGEKIRTGLAQLV
ncbi:MAG: NAD(P)/FAD-dependent oxidoreductase [Bacillota bacterium]